MKVFSASQAVSPAIERTKNYLFRPFAWGTYLKLSVVACITEGFSARFNYSTNQHSSSGSGYSPGAFTGFHLSNEIIALIVLAALVAIAIGIFIFYLVTRLRFAFFHCLAHQTKEIRPGWRLYRAQATRFFKLNLIVAVVFIVVVALAALPFVFGFIDLFRAAEPGKFPVGGFILLFLPALAVILVVVLLCCVVDLILRDLMLPHMALENASVREAWLAACARIKAEKGAFLFYAFLRLVLPALAGLGLFMALFIPLLVIFGILAISEIGFNAALANATGMTRIFLIALEAIVGLFTFVIGLFVAISLGGPIATWIRNYALIFYGGRYQALGEILVPPAPPIPSAPEVA
ncbi:MAG: hypothetical protein ABSF16_11220 [Terracidiphilus sp.]|jgi:hypothetical protein